MITEQTETLLADRAAAPCAELVRPATVPPWFRWNHGFTVSFEDRKYHLVGLNNSIAHLSITPVNGRWLVKCHITTTPESKSIHEIWVSGEELSHAFDTLGLQDADDRPGFFIRDGNFLNIPGPGTGKDGDPNLSIYLTDEIRAAIRAIASPQ